MVHQARGLALSLLVTLALAGAGLAQSAPAVLGPPVTAPTGLAPLWGLGALAPAACPAGPPACAAFEDHNGSLLIGDPLLDGPAGLGWFGAVDVGVVKPHLSNGVAGIVNLSGFATPLVSLPSAPLQWTASPRFELGYRFGQGAGEIIFAYRFLAAQGSQTINGLDLTAPIVGSAALRTRFDLQVADLDYGSYEHCLGPNWDMKWRVGLRLANVYFDSQAVGVAAEQHTTNHFIGVGPHAALDLRRKLADTGLALFGRVDAASPIGQTTQTAEETLAVPGAAPLAGVVNQHQYYPPLALGAQLGASWTPGRPDGFRVTAGYTYERWFDTATLFAFPPISRAQFFMQGVFVRAEWNY